MFGWFIIFMVFTGVQVVTAFYIEDRFGVTDRADVIDIASIALFSMAIVTLVVQIVVMQVWKLSPEVVVANIVPAVLRRYWLFSRCPTA